VNDSFSQLGLHPTLIQTVADLGYESPTPIQQSLIPVMLSGRDVIGQAQTGTGKTAAFALPILNTIEPGSGFVQALVIAPTRELATQVATAMHQYGRAFGVQVLPVYGGQPYGRQISRLRKGVDVVVGTPGRLLDLIKKDALALGSVTHLVLDEADEMLSMGFIEDIEAILEATPANRQTALLSATMPAAIRKLAAKYLRDPESCAVAHQHQTGEAISHKAYHVHQRDKLAALERLLEVEPVTSALVFAQTRIATAKLAADLSARGFPAEALNGEMNQTSRTAALQRFRDGQTKLLVATDVAARGLDIDHVSHVFNVDLPLDPSVYVHRVGRTGRAGRSGVAISLVSPRDRSMLKRIEKLVRESITVQALPSVDQVLELREQSLLEKVEAQLAAGAGDADVRLLSQLAAAGHDPIDIAAAALALVRSNEPGQEVAPIAEVKGGGRSHSKKQAPRGGDRKSSSHEQGMVRLSLSSGRAQGVLPGQIVSAIARHADIPGKAIGKIRIEEEHTLVDVPAELAGQVLAQDGSCRIGKHFVSVQRV